MGALHFQAVVGLDHKIEIALPASVPAGPVDVVVNIPEIKSPQTGNRSKELVSWLNEIKLFSEQFKGRHINLSQAVIDNRRNERY